QIIPEDDEEPVAIPISADLNQPPPMIERKQDSRKAIDPEPQANVPEPPPAAPARDEKHEEPQQTKRPTGPMFKKRPPDDEDDLDNRGGNLPDEKYKVKAKGDSEDSYEASDMDEVFARSKILYDLKKSEKR